MPCRALRGFRFKWMGSAVLGWSGTSGHAGFCPVDQRQACPEVPLDPGNADHFNQNRKSSSTKEWAEMDEPGGRQSLIDASLSRRSGRRWMGREAMREGALHDGASLEMPLRAGHTNCVRIFDRRFAVAKEWAEMDGPGGDAGRCFAR